MVEDDPVRHPPQVTADWHGRHGILQDFITTSDIVITFEAVPARHLLPSL
jgi:hypothetical protein